MNANEEKLRTLLDSPEYVRLRQDVVDAAEAIARFMARVERAYNFGLISEADYNEIKAAEAERLRRLG